jgi:hypothetical protein
VFRRCEAERLAILPVNGSAAIEFCCLGTSMRQKIMIPDHESGECRLNMLSSPPRKRGSRASAVPWPWISAFAGMTVDRRKFLESFPIGLC